MINLADLIEFVRPFYTNKDIMHDLSHIERIINSTNKLLKYYPEITDSDLIYYGCYFHGFIYLREDLIRDYLEKQGLGEDIIEKIVRIMYLGKVSVTCQKPRRYTWRCKNLQMIL